MPARKIKVLIVDDSALARRILTDLLSKEPDIEVVGTAPDPVFARQKIAQLRPDVLTLDVTMPQMDGLTFLESLMRDAPMPVVMVSQATDEGCETTMRALELGAIDFVTKPRVDVSETLSHSARSLPEKIRTASRARFDARPREIRSLHDAPLPYAVEPIARPAGALAGLPSPALNEGLIVIGTSTGGPRALHSILSGLPPAMPPIAIVQHMPPQYTRVLAERLDSVSALEVREARQGEPLRHGQVRIAPGDQHLEIQRRGNGYAAYLSSRPPVGGHRPSIDVLFRSAAVAARENAVGVLLTGMGDDGAAALKQLREAGAFTVAEDQSTCVVYGMPREAVRLDAAQKVLPLPLIHQTLASLFA